MQALPDIKILLEKAVPGAQIEIVPNDGPAGQASLLIDGEHAVAIANTLRYGIEFRFDYASNVTGVDWPKKTPPCLETVYHLYSIARREGPLVIRMRTKDRAENVTLPSLIPVWRSCEFQEREIFDLYGIVFEGHPDLRRILMWDGFTDHPMRKDYVAPEEAAV